MKKYFLSLGLIVAATFTLTNCTEQIDSPVEPVKTPFEIVASTVDTKTAVGDNLSTVWTEGDALNVFHIKSGQTEYVNDGKFELSGENVFKGEVTGTFEEEVCYNWYAFYPYSSYITTPANTSNGWTVVGSTSSAVQTQTGNNSMSHIAGENYPLYGVVEDWEYAEEEPVNVKMSHVTSLLEVVVANNTGKDLVVESVSFVGTEDVVGTYYVDFSNDDLGFVPRGVNYVSNAAMLEVVGGEIIPNGESAKFYLAIKPFTATGELSLAVNNIAKPKTVTDMVFASGAIKTLNYTMLATDVLETSDIEDAIAVTDGTIVQIEGIVVARYNKGFLVKDATGYMLVYENATPERVVGDKVTVTGPKNSYGGLSQIKTPTIKVVSTGNTVTHPTPTVLDGAALDAQVGATSVSYVQFTGKLSAGSYYNVTVDGASTGVGSVQYPEPSLGLNALNGKNITVTGYYIGTSNSKYVNTMAVSVEEVPTVDDPVISCTEAGEVTITCATEGAKVYYTIDGTDPSANNGTEYTAPFTVVSGTTVNAIGINGEYVSTVVSYIYVSSSEIETTTLTISMSDIVEDNGYIISAGNDATCYTSLSLNDVVTMSTSGGANCGSFWGTSPIDWRLYQAKSGDVTISVKDGYMIKSVKFTYNISNSGTLMYNGNSIESGTSYDVNSNTVTYVVGNTGTKTNGQVKIKEVEVVYWEN